MSEDQTQPQFDKPEDAVEDLAPSEADEAKTRGGNTASSITDSGQKKYSNITLK